MDTSLVCQLLSWSPLKPLSWILPSSSLARLIFQLMACPDHFASADVYTLLSILRAAPVDGDLILINQDLAGFSTSIDQARFLSGRGTCSWTSFDLKYVGDNEVFSVYPGKTNNPGDLIKGRTFRRLNITRKISIKDVPSCAIPHQNGIGHANVCFGQPLHPSTSWRSDGKSFVSGTLLNGNLHQ